MTAEQWAQVREVLHAVLELKPGQRPAYLDQVCIGQPWLRQEVESFILSHDHLDPDFLETISPEGAGSHDGEATPSLVGRLIGPYRIVEEIGAGGMGEVYRAVRADDQYQKQVAIKVVRRGFDTDSGLRRFKAERQILASLDHPNIARLLDSGSTDDGLPYVVMELVEGKPIDEYCDGSHGHNLSLIQRLQLFRLVCAAVHYAHQNLVVHRDLKPSNILVTEEGVPKLLDFGIAKLLAPETFGQPLERTATFQRAMTPEFASPEQVLGAPITTASDVYSLGVILYQLLTGCSPYRTTSEVPHEFAREICELEPQKPSMAIVGATEPIPGDGGARQSLEQETRRLRRRLSGDLDNIVLMALRKEPQRRYASAEQFSEDIRRYLEKLPVLARNDTFIYRADKFVRRHRAGVAAAAVIIMALIAGTLTTLWQARVARLERDKAQRRFNEVRKLANAVLFKYHDGIQKLPGATPVREMMVKDALEYLDKLYQESEGDSSLQRELAAAYAKVGDVQGSPHFGNIGDAQGAVESYRKALTMRERIAAADRSNAADQKSLANSYLDLGSALGIVGDHARCLDFSRKALEIYRMLAEIDPASAKARSDLARGHWHVANASDDLGDLVAAIDHYGKAARIYEDLSAADPSNPQHRRNAALTYKYLATLVAKKGDIQRALELDGQAIALDKLRVASDPDDTQAKLDLSFSYGEDGSNRITAGDTSGALASYQQALDLRLSVASADPKNALAQVAVARAYESIGVVLMLSGKPTDALKYFQKDFQRIQSLAAADPKNALMQARAVMLRARMGNAMVETGRVEEGRRVLEQALVEAVALAKSSDGTKNRAFRAHVDQAHIEMWMGEALERAGNSSGALQHYSRASQMYSDVGVNVLAASNHLGRAYLKTRNLPKAGEEYHKALSIADSMISSNPANAANVEVLYALADTYAGLGDLSAMLARKAASAKERSTQWSEARHWYEKSLNTWQRIPNPGSISPTGFEASDPRQIARRVAQCSAELLRLPRQDSDLP